MNECTPTLRVGVQRIGRGFLCTSASATKHVPCLAVQRASNRCVDGLRDALKMGNDDMNSFSLGCFYLYFVITVRRNNVPH